MTYKCSTWNAVSISQVPGPWVPGRWSLGPRSPGPRSMGSLVLIRKLVPSLFLTARAPALTSQLPGRPGLQPPTANLQQPSSRLSSVCCLLPPASCPDLFHVEHYLPRTTRCEDPGTGPI